MSEILKKFNLSYSAWSTYKQSQLQFYFQYILKAEATDEAKQVYGKAGNVVHEALQHYAETRDVIFETKWNDYKIDEMSGINNAKLSKDEYYKMYLNGVEVLKKWNPNAVSCEEKFEEEFFGIKIKGFYDVIIRLNDEIIIKDWKTNSKHNELLHEDQRLFYSWFIWKTENKIPRTKWYYLKDNKCYDYKYTEERLIEFENSIREFIEEIKQKGFNIHNYHPGDWKNPFNTYYTLCKNEIEKRQSAEKSKLVFEIKGHFVFIRSAIDPILDQGFDYATKFDLIGKHYMQERAREYGKGVINLEDVGTYHLYNKNYKCFPIGMLNKIKTIIKEYEQYYNKIIDLEIIDKRDQNIMNQKLNNFGSTAFYNHKLRDYQRKAIEEFLKKETGIIQIATGGGKTFTAGEIIRNIDGKTLWICDRKELLNQTKKSLEEQLNIKLGIISAGEVDIKDITIATVQSLKSKLNEIQDYLYTVNFVIVDEFHKSAAESYQKVFAKLPHTKYKLGLTATPERDDGKTPILNSILGDIIYKITTEDLINQGYLVKPEIIFYKCLFARECENYLEDYQNNIIDFVYRTNVIVQTCIDNQNKKILILTKSIEHGIQLNKYLPNALHIHGSSTNRQAIYDGFINNEYNILIMTLSIGAEGLDIPNLDIIINAAANKGDVKSIQVLGRVLRTFEGKKRAQYIDFLDMGKWTNKHAKARIKAFRNEGHVVTIK